MTSSFCGKCGSAVLDSTDVFCRSCGASLIALRLAQSSPAGVAYTGLRNVREVVSNGPSSSFIAAGWLSFIAAAILVVAVGLGFALGITGMKELIPAATILISIAEAVMIYCYWRFRVLLASQLQFLGVNGLLLALMALQFVFTLQGLFMGTQASNLGDPRNTVATVLSVAKGLLIIWLGITLLQGRIDLYGLGRPFCYASVAMGVGQATVFVPLSLGLLTPTSILLTVAFIIAALLGGVAAFVWYVTLGRIFLRASR